MALDVLLDLGLGLGLGLDEDATERHSLVLAEGLISGVESHGWHPHRPLTDAAASPHIIALSHPTLQARA